MFIQHKHKLIVLRHVMVHYCYCIWDMLSDAPLKPVPYQFIVKLIPFAGCPRARVTRAAPSDLFITDHDPLYNCSRCRVEELVPADGRHIWSGSLNATCLSEKLNRKCCSTTSAASVDSTCSSCLQMDSGPVK